MFRFVSLSLCISIFLLSFSPGYGFYKETTSLPEPRQMYGAAVLGDYLYVLGGNSTGGFVTSVVKAPILPDGNLGQWTLTTPLPQSRAYIENSTIVLNDVLYVVGGHDGIANKSVETMIWTRPQTDGNLMPWRESLPFSSDGINCTVVVSTPGHIHIIAGQNNQKMPTNTVFTAVLDKYGDFIQWEQGPPLPISLWFHNAGVVAGRLWVWGGLPQAGADIISDAIFSAPILADGRLGLWRIEDTRLPQPFYRAACSTSGSYLLTFCPSYTGDIQSNDIWYSMVLNDGLSPWQRLTTDIKTKVYISVATDFRRGLIFLPGGRIERKTGFLVDKNVYSFKLSRSESTVTDSAAQTSVVAQSQPSDQNVSHLSYMYHGQTSTDVVKGFIPYDAAREAARSSQKPMIVYFHAAKPIPCQTQRKNLEQFDTQTMHNSFIFGWVDSERFPQLLQQLGVFRVPSWLYFDNSGNIIKRKTGIFTVDELNQWLMAR